MNAQVAWDSRKGFDSAEPRLTDGLNWQRLFLGLPHRNVRLSGASCLRSALELTDLLIVASGEAQAVYLAENLADALRGLEGDPLLKFLKHLVDEFGAKEAALRQAASAYLESPDPQRAVELHATAAPRRIELFRRLNMAPGGTALIVKLREKILNLAGAHPELAPLEADLHQLLASWFNRGFLRLERINWDSPAALLENIIRYEAVHEIRDWSSLRTRLEGNRRCFGFFHPAMPSVPLIFVEVALTTAMSDAIDPMLAEAGKETPLQRPTNAVFYSINNCHVGLKGINLGDLLIKQVVLELRTEFPSLKEFATLSPIPGFARWLSRAQQVPGRVPTHVTDALAIEEWQRNPELAEPLRKPVLALCADYLTGRLPDGDFGGTSDPVARFHLTNGARLERINWQADESSKGRAESLGLMVNYRYQLSSIETNHRAFVDEGRVSASASIKQLLRSGGWGSRRFRHKPALARH